MQLMHNGKVLAVDPRVPAGDEVGWLHLENPTLEEMDRYLLQTFDCHPLAIEDMTNFGQRAKLDHYPHQTDAQVFISFFSLQSNFQAAEFCLIVSERYVISVVKEPIPWLAQLYERVKDNADWMESTGSLLYRILDICVDGYFQTIDELENRLDDLEQQVFDHPEYQSAPIIFHLKRQIQGLRRKTTDGRNVIGIITHDALPFTREHHQVYFVDVYDHVSRVVDALDSVRDNLSGLLDLQTAQRANRMNEVMKTLTIISTLFLPLSFIVGLYGMNFKSMPELSWSFGYTYVWVLMLAVTLGFVVYFKRKRWW